jgi:hypothetical protein
MKRPKSLYTDPIIQVFLDMYKVSISEVVCQKLNVKVGDCVSLHWQYGKIFIFKSEDNQGCRINRNDAKSFNFRAKRFMTALDDTIHFLKNEGTSYIFDVNLETMEITFNRSRKNK